MMMMMMVCFPLTLAISADSFQQTHIPKTGVLSLAEYGWQTTALLQLHSLPAPSPAGPMQPTIHAISITKATMSSSRTLQRYAEAYMTLSDKTTAAFLSLFRFSAYSVEPFIAL
jgi:hypothetical protein